eukprot:jgi/Botrbrau1/21927/Bobra.0249s0051.1
MTPIFVTSTSVHTIGAENIFRTFTACPGDPHTLILDVRPLKDYSKKHILQSYNVRLSANGKALLDYSKNSYDVKWSPDCWWDKPVVVYGPANLKKDHPVVTFLAREGKCKILGVYKEGIDAFAKEYPFLVSQSTKANSAKMYPGEIIPGVLYLGDWESAKAYDRLDEIKVKRIITVHNNPENLNPPSRFKHLKFTMADVETEDISKLFAPTYDFIEEAREAKHAVLVHCGAGVSRSASICIAYLMRKLSWTAERARAHCKNRRSYVNPNDGFWRCLCAFEAVLNLPQRSDVDATSGGKGSDAPPVQVDPSAAGDRVTVTFKSAQQLAAEEELAKRAAAVASSSSPPPATKNGRAQNGNRSPAQGRNGYSKDRNGDRERSRSRDRDRYRERSRSRDRGRHRGRSRSRDRGRGRDPYPRTERDSSRDRPRHRERERSRDRARTLAEDHRDGRGHREKAASFPEDRTRDDPTNSAAPPAVQSPADVAAASAVQPPKKNDSVIVLEVRRNGEEFLGKLFVEGLTKRKACVFGRHPQLSDVVVEHASISRLHAKLTLDSAGSLLITDLKSSHNTWVDGAWIRAEVPRALKKGSIFRLGASSRHYQVEHMPPTTLAAKKAAAEAGT